MEYGKYIIVKYGMMELAIMFDLIISHDDFLKSFNKDKIVAAGFFAVGAKPNKKDSEDISISVFGKSTNLGLEVRKDIDERLIKRVLRKNN